MFTLESGSFEAWHFWLLSQFRLCKAINATKCGCGDKDGTTMDSWSTLWSRSLGKPAGALRR
jgi:hypothetical protein